MIAGSPKSFLSRSFFLLYQACCRAGYSSSRISVSSRRLIPRSVRRAALRRLLSFVMAALLLGAVEAHAKEGAKDELHAKLDTFTVNLPGPTQKYLQVDLTLSLANVEAGERIKAYMPVIRHKIILLLTSKDERILRTNRGKLRLLKEARWAANSAIQSTEEEGVADVLFASFVIQ